jgi:hypothetical protein
MARRGQQPTVDTTQLSPDGEVVMGSATLTQEDFYQKSQTESICMCCYLTVRADRYVTLDEAQELHSVACLMRLDKPVPYTLR